MIDSVPHWHEITVRTPFFVEGSKLRARNVKSESDACHRINTIGTYNVIDAALKYDIRKIIFASSETTYEVCFADGERKPDYLPIDENHPTIPEDRYAMSKVVNEVTARSFQCRSGADIYGLRINNVIEPHEYQRDFPTYLKNPGMRRRNIFAYIDARDLGQLVDKGLQKNGLGFQIFNVSNDDHSVDLPTSKIVKQFYQGVSLTGTMGENQTFFSNEKAKKLLGFAPEHSWRIYVKG